MPTYHTQPRPTWRDKFTQRELRLIKNARTYAEVPWDGDDPAGLPNHDLLMLVARLSEALDMLPLHEVSPDILELMPDFFEAKRRKAIRAVHRRGYSRAAGGAEPVSQQGTVNMAGLLHR